MDVVTFGLGIPLGAGLGSNGKQCDTMASNAFGNFGAGHTTGGRAGKQWEAMDLVTFGLDLFVLTLLISSDFIVIEVVLLPFLLLS